MTVIKKAVAYVRVSTEEQLKNGNGLTVQIESIKQYAKDNGYEIVEVFNEESLTGKSKVESRVEFVKMEDYLESHEDVNTVIVYNTDRLARLQWVQGKIIWEYKNEKNWVIESVTQMNVMADDPQNELLFNILGAFAQFEASKISARLRDGRIQKAREGAHAVGSIPLGYKTVKEGRNKILVKDDVQIELVRLIFKLREERKMTFKGIAEYLNEHGYKPKRGGKQFYDSTIRTIINNPKYKGKVVLKQDGEVIVENIIKELAI